MLLASPRRDGRAEASGCRQRDVPTQPFGQVTEPLADQDAWTEGIERLLSDDPVRTPTRPPDFPAQREGGDRLARFTAPHFVLETDLQIFGCTTAGAGRGETEPAGGNGYLE